MNRLRAQPRLPRAFQKHWQLDQVLIGKAVRPVVRHCGSPFQIGGSQLRRKRVQLHQQKPKTSDVRRPTAQVPHQIFLQFIGRNLLPQSRKGAGRFSFAASLDVIQRRRIGTVVIQERTNVQQIVNVQAEIVEIGRQLRRPVDIALNHVKRRTLRLAQRLLGHTPRYFIEIRANQYQRMLVEHLSPSRPRLHHRIQMFQKCAVAAAHIANSFWLACDRPVKNFDNNFIHFLEICPVSPAAPPHIHSPIHQQLDAAFVHPRNARISEEQSADQVEQGHIRDGHAIGSCQSRGIFPAGGQSHRVVFARHPTLRGQQIEHAAQAPLIPVDILNLHRPRLQLRKDSAARQRHHGRAYEDAVQMPA